MHEEVIKRFREKFKNPYPEDIFIEPTKEEFKKSHEVLKEQVGIQIDKLSGSMGRNVFNYLTRDFEQFLLTELKAQEDKLASCEQEIEKLENRIRNILYHE